MLLDPAAKAADGEAVRIARDVLSGGADVKVALPENAAELDRVLSHRGRRRPVVVGSDLALQRVVQALHRHGSWRPGRSPWCRWAAVAKWRWPARSGCRWSRWRRPARCSPGCRGSSACCWTTGTGWCSARCGSLGATGPSGWLAFALGEIDCGRAGGPAGERLRIEADGRELAGAGRQPRLVALRLPAGAESAEVVVRAAGAGRVLLRVRASRITVAGPDFGYEADGCPAGPVPARTWTAHPAAWHLVLPTG